MAIYTSPRQMSHLFYSQLAFIICAALTIRVVVSIWGHSGEGKPPMHGDLEAQRHWMEITVNLPVEDWYVNTSDNDLQYWGLDYPPLTAYHMMLNGYVAQLVHPDMVALQSSHGMETKEVKFFMRSTVLVMDILVFLPIAVAYFLLLKTKDESEMDVLLGISVLVGFPGLILIDNGHFQYNNASLGLLVLATLALSLKLDLAGAAIFCLALNYKQMELYHAAPFFFYLLGLCLKQTASKGFYKLMTLGLVVVITFVAVWSPFLSSKDSALAVVQRIFPFNRGLYEDKVATVWCSLSVIVKFKELVSPSVMATICLVFTVAALLPSSLHLLKNPTITNFHYAGINSSLVFFLFSFHVHEKSILLAAISACLLVKKEPLVVFWFLLISTFSMLPLLIKDGLVIPTISLCGLFWMMGLHYFPLFKSVDKKTKIVFSVSMVIAVCLSVATCIVPPPQRFPDIFPLLVSVYSCGHFILFAIYFHLKQLNIDLRYNIRIKKLGEKVDQVIAVSSIDSESSYSDQSMMNLRKRKPLK